MPAHAKDPSVRARRNKTTTRAVLKPQTNPKVPPLPKGTRWYPQVRDWWQRAWSSPMVPEWTASDVDALYLAARLQQQFWDPECSPNVCRALAGEIRQLFAQCGLTPMSRRSLQWEIQRVEEGEQKAAARRAGTQAPAKKTAQAADPRVRRLRAVK